MGTQSDGRFIADKDPLGLDGFFLVWNVAGISVISIIILMWLYGAI